MFRAGKESLTIIIPVYNEEANIYFLSVQLKKFLRLTPVDTTVLWVDDGSTDNSCKRIEQLCHEDHRFTYLFLEENRGLSAALRAGIDSCTSTLIGYMDADAETSPMDFLHLLEFIPWYGLVMGYRGQYQRNGFKRFVSKLTFEFRQWLLHDDVKDACCPLKLMQAELAHRMPFFNGMHRFIPSLIMMQGEKVKQLPVRHFKRYAGHSKARFWNTLFSTLAGTLFVRWLKKNYANYSVRSRHIFSIQPG